MTHSHTHSSVWLAQSESFVCVHLGSRYLRLGQISHTLHQLLNTTVWLSRLLNANGDKATGEMLRKFNFLGLFTLKHKTLQQENLRAYYYYVTTYSLVFHSTVNGRLVEVSVDCFYWLGYGDLIK